MRERPRRRGVVLRFGVLKGLGFGEGVKLHSQKIFEFFSFGNGIFWSIKMGVSAN